MHIYEEASEYGESRIKLLFWCRELLKSINGLIIMCILHKLFGRSVGVCACVYGHTYLCATDPCRAGS